jgi:glycosyltransferase involved in cell wall biosynthesis
LNRQLRIAIVYDRVFPASYGGAERWFRLLAESLATAGHQVTYLTVAHWPGESVPQLENVQVVPLTTASQIYSSTRRRLWPVVGFGAAVAHFLWRRGASFDVVHSSALAPGAAHAVVSIARRHGYLPVLDWWEVWGDLGWQSYLGRVAGKGAARLEHNLAGSSHLPIVYSQLHAERLAQLRGRNDALRLSGVHPGAKLPVESASAHPYILLANRLIPEKQTARILPALLLARQSVPELGAVIVGSGPREQQLRGQITDLGLSDSVHMLQNLDDGALAELMQHALCVALLSRREGYGLVVSEAMRYGTPAIVLDHPDSAATERIEANENGLLVTSLEPQALASAILRLHAAGKPFRERTLAWRKRHDGDLTIDHSLPTLVSRYQQGAGERRNAGWRNARP